MPRSQLERVWIVGASIVSVVVMLIGYMFFISPQRDQTSQVGQQVSQARQQNTSLNQRIAAMAAQNKNLATYQKALDAARLALPATSGLPDFLRTLQAIGNATLTNVTDLSVSPPAPVSAPTAAQPSAPTTATSTASAAPNSSLGSAPPAPALYTLSITAIISGTTAHLDEFLRQLQSVQPRAVLISGLVETSNTAGTSSGAQASAANGQTSLQLTMSAFVAPGSSAPAATPSGTPTR